jgi:hypothetical protein
MRIKHQVTVFDTADLATESTFRAGVLGGTVDGEPRMGSPLAPGHPFCLCWSRPA